MKKINLAIRGGGVKVPAIGVMKTLEEEQIEISGYSGTSIGAIIATLGAIETHADFVIKPNVYMGTFGTPEDIAEAAKIGYVFAKKRMEELLRLIR